ncbi:MAG TPA: barstar family protein [Leadbetterella sp.]|nr:barstar family protein [Leadbetterella sp.]
MKNLDIVQKKDIPSDFAILEIDANKVTTLRDFYEILAETMHFPDYFGFNLDSLDELLNDLSWIEDEKLAVYFTNSEKFLEKERNETKILTLLDLLDATCEDWKWHEMYEEDEDFTNKELFFGFDKSQRMEDLLNKLL